MILLQADPATSLGASDGEVLLWEIIFWTPFIILIIIANWKEIVEDFKKN